MDGLEQKKDALWKLCEKFIEEQRIWCVEVVAQSDRVSENACDFIYDICELVGYHQLHRHLDEEANG